MSPLFTPEIIVIGGSAGSVRVLIDLLEMLPATLPVALIIVLHRPKNVLSELDTVLSRPDRLVREPVDKEPVRPGNIYLAPQNYHLLIDEGLFGLDSSEPVNYSRPAIDVTFESVADAFGGRVMGILLSGSNQDGTLGLTRIINRGGIGIVQCPASAEFTEMPRSALAANPAALRLSPLQITHHLISTFTAIHRLCN